jgi:hypothetical protein
VSLIQLQAKGNQGVAEASKVISDAAMRGASLVSQLLNFAAKGARKRIKIDLSSFLRDSRELYGSLLGRDINLIVDGQLPEGIALLADSNQLQQVITNMLANAKDAIGDTEGGEVSISTHSVIIRSGDLGPDISPGSYVRIDLRDNGVGMNDEAASRCFEPFFTTKNIDRDTGVGLSGTGLGLAAAYSIIREHDGAITVHSREGEGSIFSVYLPIVCNERPNKNSAELTRQSKPVGVLLLGIESGVQPFVSSALESLGCVARGVFDLRQARELIEREQDAWNIIILDKEGLGAQGSLTCKEVASACPKASVICLCSQGYKSARAAEGESVKDGQETPVDHTGIYHIEKPITVWCLEKVINKIRDRSSERG